MNITVCSDIPAQVRTVLDRIKDSGGVSYIVGGCVRDMLLGKVPNDYDVATNLLPEQVLALFSGFTVVETGLKHGTVTVLVPAVPDTDPRMPVEVTTFRTDGEYLDNRRPANVTFTDSLKEDTGRRDFTINALALDGDVVIDYFGGESDLRRGIVRCVQPAGQPGGAGVRFREDALRILRGLRFACTYDFTIEAETASAMHDNCALIDNLSGERKRAELCKFIMSGNPGRIVELLLEYADVFARIVPEIATAAKFEQHSAYHCYDVLEHTARAVSYAPRDLPLRMAMLLHDLGKPASYTPLHGVGHFPNHALAGEAIASRVTNELHFDNKTAREIALIVRNHDVRLNDTEAGIKRQLREFGERGYFRILAAHIADNKAKSDLGKAQNPALIQIRDTARRIVLSGACYKLSQLAVSGDDMLSLGIRGVAVGEYLAALLDEVIAVTRDTPQCDTPQCDTPQCDNTYDALMRRAAEMRGGAGIPQI
ncbi:polynucleotide adenylyltransferase [Clostridia bacterium]|nr:polynucleotide adenylyltransferase [Clostridia bacterium]